MRKKAVVLLSGGLDSSTVLYIAKKEGYDCHCLIFDYGQRHKKELVYAAKIAKTANCPYKITKINIPWSDSSLLDKNVILASEGLSRRKGSRCSKNLPSTYVPGRNTIFISFALSYAETLNASAIFIGANAIDYSGYPDCRPEYIRAWNSLIKSLGLNISIQAPLIRLTKRGIIELGILLGVPYKNTWSCYSGGKAPCGKCDSCLFRGKGFKEAGKEDPAKLLK